MKYKSELSLKRTILYVLMIFFALLAVIPIYLMLINATRTNAQINSGISLLPGTNTLQNWKNLTSRSFKIWRGFGNSAVIAIFSTVLGVYFSTLTAYGIQVYKFFHLSLLMLEELTELVNLEFSTQ